MMVPTRSAVDAIGSSVCGSATIASVAKLRGPWACACRYGSAAHSIASRQAPSRLRLDSLGRRWTRPAWAAWGMENSFMGASGGCEINFLFPPDFHAVFPLNPPSKPLFENNFKIYFQIEPMLARGPPTPTARSWWAVSTAWLHDARDFAAFNRLHIRCFGGEGVGRLRPARQARCRRQEGAGALDHRGAADGR